MTEIVDGVFLGGDSQASDFKWLKRHNIRYILNMTPGKTQCPIGGVPNYFESKGCFVYKRCPLYDNGTNDIRSVVPDCVRFIRQGIHYGNVLIHCVQGVSRSVSIVVGYLMLVQRMSLKRALKTIRKKRPNALPNKYFMDQLKELAKSAGSMEPSVYAGPPVRRRPTKIEEGEESKLVTKGPVLPPHMRRDTKNKENSTDGEIIGCLDEKSERADNGDSDVAIGPALPPFMRQTTLENRAESNKNDSEKEREKASSVYTSNGRSNKRLRSSSNEDVNGNNGTMDSTKKQRHVNEVH